MNKHITHIILAAIVLILSSCATLFNTKKTSLTIITSKPGSLIICNDTLKNNAATNVFTVYRDKNPIRVTAFTDSISKTINIKSGNSFAYWLNIYPNLHLWSGFYIDTKTKKRYTYPKTVYIDLATTDTTYLTYKPLDKAYSKYSNIIKITPLKLVDLVNPSIELSYERITGRSFSTQLMASCLLPINQIGVIKDFNPEIKGFRFSVEEKFYFKKSAPLGPYAGFEFNYLNNQYKDIWSFDVKNTNSGTAYNYASYSDTFGIKKQTFSFNLKFGYQIITKRLAIDFYAGLGLRYKDVRHFDRINPNDEMEIPRHPNVYYLTNLEGKYWTISIPLNLRIGWTF